MGNCLQPSKIGSQVHDEPQHQEKSSRDINVNGEPEEGTKVKIVLTKEELEWLMCELKGKNNNKKLEEALAEIQRNRALKSIVANNNCWQPSLESISEDDLDESER